MLHGNDLEFLGKQAAPVMILTGAGALFRVGSAITLVWTIVG